VNFISIPQEVRGIFVTPREYFSTSKLQDEIKTGKFELNKFHAGKKNPFY
jgi:predicted nucleotidyltransferase